jgi:hypothetical protein
MTLKHCAVIYLFDKSIILYNDENNLYTLDERSLIKTLNTKKTGGLSETPLHGGLVGPTFACIIGIQFRNLRKCDRFWYENSNPLIRFTEAQLAEIRKMTLSKVICDNCDQVLKTEHQRFSDFNKESNVKSTIMGKCDKKQQNVVILGPVS